MWKHFSKEILFENPCWSCWQTIGANFDEQQEAAKNENASTNQTSWWAPLENPGVYRALSLLGNMLEVAWERAFIRTYHF